MYATFLKKSLLVLSILVSVTLACDLSVNVAPTTAPTVAETPVLIEPPTTTPEVFIALTQAIPATAVIQPSPVINTWVTFGRLTLEIPSSVASGANGIDVPPATDDNSPYWEKTPGHLQVSLQDYYVLQGKFHQAQIYIYPATDYAILVPGAFESMHRLRNLLSDVVPVTAEQLPGVPFFNATQVFASNIQEISFQNGEGMRFVSEYAQYFAPANNHELVYHFQGFTDDGEYYIIALLPITAPALAETSDVGADVPAGGIAFPDINNSNLDFQSYYASITDLLNATSPEAFTPPLSQLDALIRSMWVAP